MAIAKKIETILEKSSWIRKMFEEGARLKALHGADKVYDFSLGNPNLQPPEAFQNALEEAVKLQGPGAHGYMPNVGYPHVREAVAAYLTKEQGVTLSADEIVMTCGAAGALNVIFKTLLDPGDEVVVPSPYFVEYNMYVDNHGGVLKTVETNPDFTLNIDALAAAITPQTKVLLLNSPNNPTGQVYSKESLVALGEMLEAKSAEMGRTIFLLSDEPYRKIVFDGTVVPSILEVYKESIVATSYSKDISVPGQRIGFIAVNQASENRDSVMAGLALCNRILGFVNAPALMQHVLANLQGLSVDVSVYDRKRKLFCDGLKECGYEFVTPPGAFYLFPRTPIKDDVAFVRALQEEEQILAVPGSGFGGPGHFRIAYCVEDQTIINAMPGFARVMKKFK